MVGAVQGGETADIEKGTVTVNDVTFEWWTTGGDSPVVTVNHPNYGRRSEPVRSTRATILARLIAEELLAGMDRRE